MTKDDCSCTFSPFPSHVEMSPSTIPCFHGIDAIPRKPAADQGSILETGIMRSNFDEQQEDWPEASLEESFNLPRSISRIGKRLLQSSIEADGSWTVISASWYDPTARRMYNQSISRTTAS
ncbi:hypothetical protein GUITHDRAFT_143998 [Guillardia theta CCMP2712]|uniref:Uncharacterized protein n=1 Tax=Guillardia theta (strain CCMP2712) TaxID=905079 RepID=L1IRD1_GUITC|nr:hypothetical protein GUITHDRAFT_143998 [Guillardia theta CCMP2712]EKX38816.1 hypothetical protein GUITHDRAFT_143998 [Guillardia theta CCMP2712]|eukprot:XP_005825796.1 hypothetical protein GUITHDRAFT_143998 [Guillardia theta CCMP2712]